MARESERQPNPSPLGGYLAAQCKERGMRLSDVAEITGKSVGYASKLFNGRIRTPGASFTVRLAKSLGLTISDLSPYCESEQKTSALQLVEELVPLLPAILADSLRAIIPGDPKLMPIFSKLLVGLKQAALKQKEAGK